MGVVSRRLFAAAMALFVGLGTGCSLVLDFDEPILPDGVPAADAPPDGPPNSIDPLPDGGPVDAAPCVAGNANATDPATGNCYMLFETPSTWNDAVALCNALGPTAHLATITSAAETQVVAPILPMAPIGNLPPDVWIGASDEAAEMNFVWVTGEALVYTNWRAMEPNNGNGMYEEDCVILEGDTGALWDDRPCTAMYYYLCERD